MDLCIVFGFAFSLASVLSSLGGVKTYDLCTFSPEGSTHIWDAAGKGPAKPCQGYPENGDWLSGQRSGEKNRKMQSSVKGKHEDLLSRQESRAARSAAPRF